MISSFAILGGGSAYAPGLLAALIHRAARLHLAEVRLYDTDGEHLRVVATLGARMALAAGAPFRVRGCADLVSALQGVDAVLNTTRPGLFECRRIDETLPVELGLPGQETVGPGGFFFALRSVPEALRAAGVLRSVAPHAVFLNYTNPTNVVTQALADHAGVRVLGLCDQSHGDLTALARALGLPGEPLSFTSIGLNHATWYGEVTLAGLPLPPVPPDLPTPSWVDEEHEIRFALSLELAARHPGRWPNSYLPYYTHPRRFVDLTRRLGPRTDAITARLPAYYTHFEEEGRAVRPDLKLHRGDKDFGDLAVDVLEALDAPEPRRLVLNVPNQGASREFGEGTVVEVAVELGAGGLTRLPAPELPPGEQPFQARLEEYQLRTVGAALSGSMQQAEAALAANPLVPDRATAAALLARAREAYGPKIPMFR